MTTEQLRLSIEKETGFKVTVSEIANDHYFELRDGINNKYVGTRIISDELLDMLELKGQWIPVTERLPEINKYVLTYSGNESNKFTTMVAAMDEDRIFWRGLANLLGITHWQPLPESPQKPLPPPPFLNNKGQ